MRCCWVLHSRATVTASCHDGCARTALQTLRNLSCNRQLHAYLLNHAALLEALVRLTGAPEPALAVNAASVLSNCAYIEPRFQKVVALAGADAAAIGLMAHADAECVGQGAWLLCNLSMTHGSPARGTLRDRPLALARLLELLASDDGAPSASPRLAQCISGCCTHTHTQTPIPLQIADCVCSRPLLASYPLDDAVMCVHG